MLFAAWTAEERGLLGSEYYATHPLYPAETMVANLTLDTLQSAGPARDVILIGQGQSDLEDRLARLAARQGRAVTPDAQPQRGLFYRADHFPLAKRGVPVLLLMALGGGVDLVTGGREAGDRWVADFTARCYHQTCDEWRADWDLRGAAQDVALAYAIGRELAFSRDWPQWRQGSEFRAVRERSAEPAAIRCNIIQGERHADEPETDKLGRHFGRGPDAGGAGRRGPAARAGARRPAAAPHASGGLTAFRSDAELRRFLRRLRGEDRESMMPIPSPVQGPTTASPPAHGRQPTGRRCPSPSPARGSPPRARASPTTRKRTSTRAASSRCAATSWSILRRGRLFTVSLAGGGMRAVDSINAFPPGVSGRGDWYDEMLVHGDRVIVVGFSYARGGTEINRFRLDAAGRLRFEDAYHLRSNDYYSSRNYASRLIGNRLVFYTPLDLEWDEDPLEVAARHPQMGARQRGPGLPADRRRPPDLHRPDAAQRRRATRSRRSIR